MQIENICEKPENDSPYIRDILALVLIALGIGIYLIASTVMVTKDGVFYIESAQLILNPDFEIITHRPALYELFILLGHTIWDSITGELTLQQQIWVAQSLTLACRVITIILFYLIGRMITGRKAAFWGCVILLVLPRPAHWGSDALREWPNLMLVAASLLSLFIAARKNCPWYLIAVGLFVGLACLIRVESAQVLIAATAVSGLMILKVSHKRNQLLWACAIVLMMGSFFVPKLVYAGFSGQFMSTYFKHYMKTVNTTAIQPETNGADVSEVEIPVRLSTREAKPPAKPTLTGFVQAVFEGLGELFAWFLFPFWILGIVLRLRDKSDPAVRWVIGMMLLTSVGLVFLRYWVKEPTLTMRWFLPFVALTSFYAYIGIEQAARWLSSHKPDGKINAARWCQILLIIGITFCVPNLIERTGAKRGVYREASEWIKSNSEPSDWLYTFDRRIGFYAERPFRLYEEDVGIVKLYYAKFLITQVEKEQPRIELPDDAIFVRNFKKNGREVWLYRREPQP